VTVFSGVHQQNFVGVGLLLVQLLPQKPHQQNLRCASKIINPNDFDIPPKKMHKGPTKRTLFEIVVFKLNIFVFMCEKGP
jgi:hypothetical protein